MTAAAAREVAVGVAVGITGAWAAVAVSGGAAASEVPKARLDNFPRMPR